MKYWSQVVAANEAGDWALALALTLVVLLAFSVALRVAASLLTYLAKYPEAGWRVALAEVLRATSIVLLVPVAAWGGSHALDLPPGLDRTIRVAAILSLLLQVALWASRLMAQWLARQVEVTRGRDPAGVTALNVIGYGARVFMWALVFLLGIEQIGINITALVAGLGIGGVAIALAVQNILGDLFASLSIVLDKPFVVGDFIVVGEGLGTVEHIGLKTTRVRALSGELIIFSNADLLKSRIHNYKRMYERRVAFKVGVTYRTPPEKLEKIPQMLRRAIEGQRKTRFDRAHLEKCGETGLMFEAVYTVLDADYNLHMDIQQAINLSLIRAFARDGIEFAYQTRAVYLSEALA